MSATAPTPLHANTDTIANARINAYFLIPKPPLSVLNLIYRLLRVLRHDRVAYLRRGHLLLSFEFQRQQRFLNTNSAVRSVFTFETTVKTLVPKALIAVAVTRQLRDRYRYLAHGAIRIANRSSKRVGIERRPKNRLARRHLKVRRHGLRRCRRWMLVTRRRWWHRRLVLYSRHLWLIARGIDHQHRRDQQQ